MASYSQQDTFADQASDYLEKHRVYELFQSLLKNLAVHKPKDPLSFMITLLGQPTDNLRIIVAGGPGTGRVSQVNKIVKEFGVVPVNVHELVREEIAKKSVIGTKARTYLDKGAPVPDTVLISILIGRINKLDCIQQGWVIEGFPTNKTQAHALQKAGCLVNKFILLDLPTDVMKKRYEEQLQHEGKGGQDGGEEVNVSAAVQTISRNLAEMVELFYDCALCVNDALGVDAVHATISKFLRKVPPSAAPRRPHRVLVLGPVGAGKSGVARALATKLGLVYTSAGALIRKEIEAKTKLSGKLSSYVAVGELCPDEVVESLVGERLLQDDARKQGWILEGFPRNVHQATYLAKLGLVPSRVLLLEAADRVCIERLTLRRVDPVNGDVYHLKHNPPPQPTAGAGAGANVAQRLVQQPQDQDVIVHSVINNYRTGIEDLRTLYARVLGEFDAQSLSPAELAEACLDFVSAPLPLSTGVVVAEEEKSLIQQQQRNKSPTAAAAAAAAGAGAGAGASSPSMGSKSGRLGR